jgi:hypothetical protein
MKKISTAGGTEDRKVLVTTPDIIGKEIYRQQSSRRDQ